MTTTVTNVIYQNYNNCSTNVTVYKNLDVVHCLCGIKHPIANMKSGQRCVGKKLSRIIYSTARVMYDQVVHACHDFTHGVS